MGKGIVRVQITCEGIRPLIMDRMPQEVLIEQLLHGKRPPANKDRKPEDIALEKVYRANGKGSAIGIPGVNLYAALKNAGRFVKYDARRSITSGSGSMLPSVLQLLDDFIPLIDLAKIGPFKEGWEVDVRQGRQGAQKIAVCVVRPIFRAWKFAFTTTMDLDKLSEETYKSLVREAGVRSGLGSMRPERGGNFGMFNVTSWQEVS